MGAVYLPVERDSGKGEDRISRLPDEILMSFVSTMGMKEAARTSIVSKRWRYLWAKGTHLDFNPLIVLPDFDVEYGYFRSRATKNKYINWVNQVVDVHYYSSPCINTFRVWFGFERGDAHHIDKWVRFAISKQVKNLELCGSPLRKSLYRLTLDIVAPSLGVNDSGIRFLQSLCLKAINVSGDVIEYVLKQCCLLERLHIECSQTLVRLKVVGFCRKLKHLTIIYCVFLEQVEIEAVNLVYLHLSGKDRWSNFVFNNIPNLVDARFYGPCVSDFAPIFQRNSHLAQISKLSLEMKFVVLSCGSLPTFWNLKQLTMMVDDEFEDELIPSINQFLKACPKLCEFKVEFTDVDVDNLLDDAPPLNELALFVGDGELDLFDGDGDGDGELDLFDGDGELDLFDCGDGDGDEESRWEYFEVRYKMELERKGHPNLREFQVAGFCGCAVDVDLILLILLISFNLETLICDCSHRHGSLVREVAEVTQVLKSRAAKLVKHIPPKITLAII